MKVNKKKNEEKGQNIDISNHETAQFDRSNIVFQLRLSKQLLTSFLLFKFMSCTAFLPEKDAQVC